MKIRLVEKFFENGWAFSEEKRGEPIGWQKYPAVKQGKAYMFYRVVANLRNVNNPDYPKGTRKTPYLLRRIPEALHDDEMLVKMVGQVYYDIFELLLKSKFG